MRTSRASILEDLRKTLILSDESLDDLINRLSHHGYQFASVSIQQADGRSIEDVSLDELAGLDGSWWRSAVSLDLLFRHRQSDGRLHVSVDKPKASFVPEKLKLHTSAEDYGAVLAGKQEVKAWCDLHAAGYPWLFTRNWLWLLIAFVLSSSYNVVQSKSSTVRAATLVVLYGICTYMFWFGCRRFFPVTQFALGSAATQAQRTAGRRTLAKQEIWTLLKLIFAAVVGAAVKTWFDHR